MRRNQFIYGTFQGLGLVFTFLLAYRVLDSEYLFQWAVQNRLFYLFLCLIPLVLLLLNKKLVSVFVTMGIVTGIFIGNYFGGWINTHNESNISVKMSAEEVARLQHHPGFEIWMGVILFSMIVGIIVHRYYKQ